MSRGKAAAPTCPQFIFALVALVFGSLPLPWPLHSAKPLGPPRCTVPVTSRDRCCFPPSFDFQTWLPNSYFIQIIYGVLAASKWAVYYLQLAFAAGWCLFLYRWAWARGFLPRNGISKPFPRRGEIVSLLLIEFPFKLRTLLSATRVPVKRDSSSKKQKIIWWGKKKMSGRGGRKGEITKPNVKSSRIYVCNKASRS